jgi:hypothetical protein
MTSGPCPFAQAHNPLFEPVQIIANRPALAPFFGDGCWDGVFVDIESKIEFSFHSVGLFVRLHVDESERFPRSVRGPQQATRD